MMKRYFKTCPAFVVLLLSMTACIQSGDEATIDRVALVTRHHPQLAAVSPETPFTVGNGEFAFTVDVTGLQTLHRVHEPVIPLVTQSQWAWHTIPNYQGFRRDQTVSYYDTYGREVPYAADMVSEAAHYFRSNPHRLNLIRIGFVETNGKVEPFLPDDLTGIRQELNLWEGMIHSSFHWKGIPFQLETAVHPSHDQIAVSVDSPAAERSGVGIEFAFPYGSTEWGKSAGDWAKAEHHITSVVRSNDNEVILFRQLDTCRYTVHIAWEGSGRFTDLGNHRYLLQIGEGGHFGFTCNFRQGHGMETSGGPTQFGVESTIDSAKVHWVQFWSSGGAVDLSGSTHPGAAELERRIVLSQYLTAIQCAGSLPPQETGLTFNSWFGKYHLEMHWWHAVQFALWGRTGLLERSVGWYNSIMPAARAKAELQGYEGVRWPKMTAYDGIDSPSSVGVFLIWQQPHPIYFAELIYRQRPEQQVLDRYRDMVFETAEFMVSYAVWDSLNSRYILGPPLIPAQEIHPATQTLNPPFELAYWDYGLRTAQRWRERLGMERHESWDHVIDHLADFPFSNGYYQNAENVDDTFLDEQQRRDHPTLLGAFGMLPGTGVDTAMMRRTLEQVMEQWNWERTWGWDYPLTAMTAARVGRPDLAIEALLMEVEKNSYLVNGHNYQSERLPVYLPGNGGLLTAIAMMCAGWDGAGGVHAPGFPGDGSWVVRYEGLYPIP